MKPQKLGRDAWAEIAKDGTSSDAIVFKVADAEIKAADGDRTLTFTISTGAADRDKDVINPEGWKLTNFKKNPSILWAHDYAQLPVGKAKRVRVEDGKVKADIEFASAEVYPFADTVLQMIKGGFLNACSVGFRPLKYAYNAERGGYDIDAAELYEVSIVPVPAHPEALVDAKAAGQDTGPWIAWAEATLKSAKHAWVPEAEQDAAAPVMVDLAPITAAIDALRADVLARIEAIEAKATETPPVDDPDYFTLDASDEAEIDLTEDAVRAGIRDAVADHIKAEVRGAINALTGQVD